MLVHAWSHLLLLYVGTSPVSLDVPKIPVLVETTVIRN